MKASIQNKLDNLRDRFEELSALLSDPETISQQDKFRNYSKEYAELEPVVKAARGLGALQREIADLEAMLSGGEADGEMRAMAQEEAQAQLQT